MINNKIWDFVPQPQGNNIVKCQWVYKTKFTSHVVFERYKACLVTKFFFLVKRHRLHWNLCSNCKDELGLTNFFTLWLTWMGGTLNGCQKWFPLWILNEEIYMEEPFGLEKDSNLVFQLKKSLYGLKQAPRGLVWED